MTESDNRIRMSIHPETYEELSKLKESGVTWDYVLKMLARNYTADLPEGEQPRLEL